MTECVRCGQRLLAGASFCQMCGLPVSEPSATYGAGTVPERAAGTTYRNLQGDALAPRESQPSLAHQQGRVSQYFGGTLLVGGWLVFLGGVLYATGQFSLVTLAGASPEPSFQWAFALLGVAYIVLGSGLFLAMNELGPALSASGGKLAFVGAFFAAIPEFLLAVAPSATIFLGINWGAYLNAVGFFIITVGLFAGFAGLAAYRIDFVNRGTSAPPRSAKGGAEGRFEDRRRSG